MENYKVTTTHRVFYVLTEYVSANTPLAAGLEYLTKIELSRNGVAGENSIRCRADSTTASLKATVWGNKKSDISVQVELAD